ncbi:MAG: hypothetical protein Crog4KO_25210 [Crocinitomicaceae bacterium]
MIQTNLKLLVLLLVSASILASCNKKKWNETFPSAVSYETSSNEVTLAGKPFVIESLITNYSGLHLKGERLQGESIDLIQANSTVIDFINAPAGPNFEIPRGTYTEMTLETVMQNSTEPSLKITGTYYFPGGTTYSVDISLEINEQLIYDVIDVDGESTILIDEDNPKDLTIYMDIEVLFSEINPGLWNAAAVTSQNGSQTIVVDELNNASIYNGLSSQIGEALIVKFQ